MDCSASIRSSCSAPGGDGVRVAGGRHREHPGRQVDTDDLPGRPDARDRAAREDAAAAPDVEHAVTRAEPGEVTDRVGERTRQPLDVPVVRRRGGVVAPRVAFLPPAHSGDASTTRWPVAAE